MTPEQARLILRTWQQLAPIADTAARLFYEQVFALEPETRLLFASIDLTQQRQKLLQALNAVVASVDRLHVLGPALEELGRRHVAYGVEDRHFDLAGQALLATLEQGLGAGFTDQVRDAWAEAYAGVVAHMRAGARRGSQAA